MKTQQFATFKNHDKGVCFVFKESAKPGHSLSGTVEYISDPSMREELELFAKNLKPNSGVKWESSIAFLIERTLVTLSLGDLCLESGGGY